MSRINSGFVDFLIEAKRQTYAAGKPTIGSSRRAFPSGA